MVNRCSGVALTPYDAGWILYRSLGWVPDEPVTKGIPWDDWYRALAETYGWTPDQIDNLTLPEIVTFLPIEDRNRNDARAGEWRQMYRKLTPAQKLALGYVEQGRTPPA